MKVKIPHNQDDDLSYYPGLNHSGEIEIEFDEYIWLIHELIDESVQNHYILPFKRKTYISAGYVYAPYIPLMPLKTYANPTRQTMIQRISNLITKGKLDG